MKQIRINITLIEILQKSLNSIKLLKSKIKTINP